MLRKSQTIFYLGKERFVHYFLDSHDFRLWLRNNHHLEKEIWIGFYRMRAEERESKREDNQELGKELEGKSLSYFEAVDIALCFGWIDGIRKRIDEMSYTNRFTPRREKSNWSQINVQRFLKLQRMNLIEPSGLKAFEKYNQNLSKNQFH
jgi:uncharacterized protein YdeI (YjbR/CyaY-like superfamily)